MFIICREHIQDGRTLSKATVSNWVRAYREECQMNDKEQTKIDFMEEVLKLRHEKSELQKENDFLKKAATYFAKEID